MKKQKEKELNAFLEKTTKAMDLEQAPKGFLQSVMKQVELQKTSTQSIRYTPLVSNTSWIGIAFVVIALFGFLGFGKNHVSADWLSVLRLNIIGNSDFLDVLYMDFPVPDSTMYAFVGLLVFMGVQVWYLKQFFAKRKVLL
jgi:hypothetical protein